MADPQLKGALARLRSNQAGAGRNREVLPIYYYFETFRGRADASYRAPRAFYSTLFKYARRLVRAAEERPKPNGERFPEFRDSNRESLELDLFSNAAGA